MKIYDIRNDLVANDFYSLFIQQSGIRYITQMGLIEDIKISKNGRVSLKFSHIQGSAIFNNAGLYMHDKVILYKMIVSNIPAPYPNAINIENKFKPVDRVEFAERITDMYKKLYHNNDNYVYDKFKIDKREFACCIWPSPNLSISFYNHDNYVIGMFGLTMSELLENLYRDTLVHYAKRL